MQQITHYLSDSLSESMVDHRLSGNTLSVNDSRILHVYDMYLSYTTFKVTVIHFLTLKLTLTD